MLYRIVNFFLILMPITGYCSSNHCTKNEDVVFSCTLRNSSKIVSLCSSKNILTTNNGGYVSYRFGAAGAVELEYPKTRDRSAEKFLYFHYFRSGVDRTSLSFSIGNYEYSLSNDFDENQKPKQSNYVTVRNDNSKKETTLYCAKDTDINWYLIYENIPCDNDDFNMCTYKYAN